MNTAINILRRALNEAGAMQHSPEATAYCNSLQLAIDVLENYDRVLQRKIQEELQKTELQ